MILLFQVPIAGQSVHYVSYKRNPFYPMKLPRYTLPKVRHNLIGVSVVQTGVKRIFGIIMFNVGSLS